MGLGLKRSSLGMMTIFAIAIITLIGFYPQNSYAIPYDASSSTDCTDMGGSFAGTTCDLPLGNTFTLTSADTLTVPTGITLKNEGEIDSSHFIIVQTGAFLTNSGTITDNAGGEIDSTGTIDNSGIINNNLSGAVFQTGPTTNSGTITINAGEISFSSTTTNTGTINIMGGQLVNFGTIDNFGGTSTITNNSFFTNSGTIDNGNTTPNSGTITNNSGGSLSNSDGLINNYAGGTITNNNGGTMNNVQSEGTATINNYGFINSGGTITNKATITNYSGGIVDNSNIFDDYGAINNSGGNINNNFGGLYDVGTISIYIGGTITNDGTITNYLDGTITNNGGLITNNGVINNKHSASIDNNSGDTLDNHGTIENDGAITNEDVINNYSTGIINNNSGGTITNSNTINNDGNINNKSGSAITNTGTIYNNSGGTITNDGTIDNNGVINNSNTDTIGGHIANNSGGIINNNDGASITNDGIIDNHGTINNNSCFDCGGATITNNSGRNINNYGTVHNNAHIDNHGTFTNFCGSTFDGNAVNYNAPITESCIHHTKLTLNPIVSPFAGNKISVNGELVDLDNSNVGIPGKLITFTTSPSVGVSDNTTSGIKFTDPSNLSVSSCSGCSGTVNVMRLHTSSTIDIPSAPPYVELFGSDMGGNTFTMTVTYKSGSTGTFTTPSIPSGTVVALALTSPANVGISSIQITGVSSGLAGISEVKTFDSILGRVIDTTFPASIPSVTTMSFNQGEFFSVGTTSITPATGLTVTANFAGDANYLPSTSTTQTFNTYASTTAGVAGIGGSETSTPDLGRLITAKTCDASGLDVDNLCKSWKGTGATNGIPYQFNTYNGGPSTAYYKLPSTCAVGQKCVFVEADSMANINLNTAALTDIQNVFASHGITLSIATGDENNLLKVPNLAVWTDTDTTFTNDFDSIKATHFGTLAEHPVLSTTQSNTILSVPVPTATSQTLEVSGVTIVTRANAATGGVTEGTLTVKVKLPMPAGTTLNTGAITQPVVPDARLKLGTITAQITPKGTFKILTLTIPFDTTTTIPAGTPASFGSIDVPLILSGTAPSVPLVPAQVQFSPAVTTTLLDAKAQAYRYVLFVDSIGGPTPPGPSGIASNSPGNKAIVALGASIFSGAVPTEQQQAGTLMHELGHLLGLGHGGPVSATDGTINCKPNYPSVMSYSRQLPTYLGSDWKLDYSSGVLPDLTETNLNDISGTPVVTSGTVTPMIIWGTPGGTLLHAATGTKIYDKTTSVTSAPPDIDWLGDGSKANGISAPISGFGTSGCSETVAGSQFAGAYHDYNDWSNLNFNFQTGSGASALTGATGDASDAALFTFGDDQIVLEPHSDYNGAILQAQTSSSSVYPGPFIDGTESFVKLDGSSVFKGGSPVELELQLFVSGTKVKLVDWPTTSNNFVGNVAPYIFAKVTTNDPFSPLNGQTIAAQGNFKIENIPLLKHYEFTWKTPQVTKTTKVYISIFVQPPALTTTPPALSSVLLHTPLKDPSNNIVTEIITLKP